MWSLLLTSCKYVSFLRASRDSHLFERFSSVFDSPSVKLINIKGNMSVNGLNLLLNTSFKVSVTLDLEEGQHFLNNNSAFR